VPFLWRRFAFLGYVCAFDGSLNGKNLPGIDCVSPVLAANSACGIDVTAVAQKMEAQSPNLALSQTDTSSYRLIQARHSSSKSAAH